MSVSYSFTLKRTRDTHSYHGKITNPSLTGVVKYEDMCQTSRLVMRALWVLGACDMHGHDRDYCTQEHEYLALEAQTAKTITLGGGQSANGATERVQKEYACSNRLFT